MYYTEFKDRVSSNVAEERYLEAFLMKSLFIESVITTLASAKRFRDRGFDGEKLSIAVEIDKDPRTLDLFRKTMKDRLSENIKHLRDIEVVGKDQVDALYTWKDKYRDHIFHNLGELILSPKPLDELANEGLEFIRIFSETKWFKRMEETFLTAEQEILKRTQTAS